MRGERGGGGVERQGERGGGDEKPVGLGHNGVGRICKLPLENALHLGNPQNTSSTFSARGTFNTSEGHKW